MYCHKRNNKCKGFSSLTLYSALHTLCFIKMIEHEFRRKQWADFIISVCPFNHRIIWIDSLPKRPSLRVANIETWPLLKLPRHGITKPNKTSWERPQIINSDNVIITTVNTIEWTCICCDIYWNVPELTCVNTVSTINHVHNNNMTSVLTN